MSKPLLLDLFCGAGGCTAGYQRAGFYVVGVDINPQPNYCGDDFIQGDALDVLTRLIGGEGVQAASGRVYYLTDFEGVHASPPCQAYHKLGNEHPKLIAPVRELLEATGLPYVIENIPDAKDELRDPMLLCGSMFDPVFADRHRLFETNWPLRAPDWPCRHKLAAPRFDVYEHGEVRKRRWPAVYGHGGGKCFEAAPAAMEIDWMTRRELVEAIPPRFTEYVGAQLLAHLEAQQAAA